MLALVGPTAAGKSRMAVQVAGLIGEVEIVSCDSMAVYRGLDVVAAKPTEAERAAVPHHLVDIVDVEQAFTAVDFRARALQVIDDIRARRRRPMLVGGSGLYFRAVVDDLSFAPSDADVRARLEADDPRALWERLVAADPEAASRIDRRNVRRIVRAVEILELTGRPPSELRDGWHHARGPVVSGLTWDRSVLYRRAEARIDAMLRAGLVDEVRSALARGASRTALQAVGVKEVVGHLAGETSLDETRTLLLRNTKRFIRRQLSWFRADPRVEWVDASELGWGGARDAIVARLRMAHWAPMS